MVRGGGCGNADTERAPVRGRQSIFPRMRIEKFCLGNRAGSALPPLPAHSRPCPCASTLPKRVCPVHVGADESDACLVSFEGMFAHQWRAHYSHPCALHGAFSLLPAVSPTRM
jgi:hypothetical protein